MRFFILLLLWHTPVKMQYATSVRKMIKIYLLSSIKQSTGKGGGGNSMQLTRKKEERVESRYELVAQPLPNLITKNILIGTQSSL